MNAHLFPIFNKESRVLVNPIFPNQQSFSKREIRGRV